jgi:hypothetical protein
MGHITIHTATQTFVLGDDDAVDLLEHIRGSGGPNREDAETPLAAAIDSGGAGEVRWSDDGKRGAVHAIDAWLLSDEATDLPDPVEDLRYELMRDLQLPPFDEETPYDPT